MVKRAYGLTFGQGGMSSYVRDLSDAYEAVRVPSEFPRKTRAITAATDLKASEWRTLVIAAFVLFNDIFDTDQARLRHISDLRTFWLLTVSPIYLTKPALC